MESGGGVEHDPRVVAARRLGEELLAPAAAEVDAGSVPRSHLDALGEAGLLALFDPAAPAPAPVTRRVQEVLAGADPATWFVQVQHHSPVRMVAAASTPVRERLLPELLTGRRVAGVAFAHLRRWPQRPVRAQRVPGGWRLDGTAPWYTGWGLNDVMALGGSTEGGQVVFAAVAARAQPGLRASPPLRLAALQATSTVRLELAGLAVADDDVLLVQRVADWLDIDRNGAANVVPAVFGVAERALGALRLASAARGSAAGTAAADALDARLAGVRQRAAALLDDVPAGEQHAERLAARASAQQLMLDATAAYVAVGAGASMTADAEAQRLARAALFLLVQGQTPPARDALLARWASEEAQAAE